MSHQTNREENGDNDTHFKLIRKKNKAKRDQKKKFEISQISALKKKKKIRAPYARKKSA